MGEYASLVEHIQLIDNEVAMLKHTSESSVSEIQNDYFMDLYLLPALRCTMNIVILSCCISFT